MYKLQSVPSGPSASIRFKYNIELIQQVPVINPKALKVAVITDAHLDPLYEAFGVADCDEPVCCRKGQKPVERYEFQYELEESIIEQSIKKNTGKLSLDLSVAAKVRALRKSSKTRFKSARNAEPAGFWGDYRNCDTPIWAFDNVIDRITETHKVNIFFKLCIYQILVCIRLKYIDTLNATAISNHAF